jgi:hypothetical protein
MVNMLQTRYMRPEAMAGRPCGTELQKSRIPSAKLVPAKTVGW